LKNGGKNGMTWLVLPKFAAVLENGGKSVDFTHSLAGLKNGGKSLTFLFESLPQAFLHLIEAFEWKSFTILYEESSGRKIQSCSVILFSN
jgi:hypothetical protein